MKPEFFTILRSPATLIVVALLVCVPFVSPTYYLHLAILCLVYIGLSLSWNIIGGIAGQLSLAHSLFVAIGAIFTSALVLRLGFNMWLAIAIATVLAVAVGAAIAWLNFRFHLGPLSFALITLAFAEMAQLLVIGWEFLGGASGLYLPKDTGRLSEFQFGSAHNYYWLFLALALLAQVVNLAVLNSFARCATMKTRRRRLASPSCAIRSRRWSSAPCCAPGSARPTPAICPMSIRIYLPRRR